MSGSDAGLDSTDTAVDPNLTDRVRPYIRQEWTDLNDRLYDVDQVHTRTIAADTLMYLSLIAEHELPTPNGADDANQAAWTMREWAVRAIRKARSNAEQSLAREAAV